MRVETPDSELGQLRREPPILLCTRSRLSLLGLGGGGGGLGISGSTSTSNAAPISPAVTVNNGSSGPLSQTTWLVIGAVALGALLIIGMLFRGRN